MEIVSSTRGGASPCRRREPIARGAPREGITGRPAPRRGQTGAPRAGGPGPGRAQGVRRPWQGTPPAIEGFEAGHLLPDIVGNGAGAGTPSDLDIARQEASHALLAEAPVEPPDRVGMWGSFVGALGGRAIGQQDQRANDLIAPLELIPQPQRQLGKLCSCVHGRSFSRLAGRRPSVPHRLVFVTARSRKARSAPNLANRSFPSVRT
jgi:hypothetical protein